MQKYWSKIVRLHELHTSTFSNLPIFLFWHYFELNNVNNLHILYKRFYNPLHSHVKAIISQHFSLVLLQTQRGVRVIVSMQNGHYTRVPNELISSNVKYLALSNNEILAINSSSNFLGFQSLSSLIFEYNNKMNLNFCQI